MHNSLDQEQIRVCEQPQVLSILSNQLKEAGISQNTAYQNALTAMLNGRSSKYKGLYGGDSCISGCIMKFFCITGKNISCALQQQTFSREASQSAVG